MLKSYNPVIFIDQIKWNSCSIFRWMAICTLLALDKTMFE